MKRFLIFVSLGFGLVAQAATYYIDFAGGSDGNAGTSKSAPWKRHPRMAGWAGSYTHVNGDRYIFKGGVTWPRSCFQMRINASNGDYYGVDQSWFSGGGWTRPIFDFENVNIGAGSAGAGVLIDRVASIIIDNIEMKRHRGMFQPGAYNCCTLLNLGSQRVVIENCHIRDWSLPGPPPLYADPAGGSGGIAADAGYAAMTVSNCVIHQSNVGYYSGCAVKMGGQILFNEIYDVPNGVIGGGNVLNNHFHHIRSATDPAAHENVILQQVPGTLAGNLIHDTEAGAEVFSLNQGWVTPNRGTVEVFNNVVYNTYAQTMSLYADGVASDLHFKIWNNTLKANANGYCIRAGFQNSPALGSIDVRNNHFISDNSNPVCFNGAQASCGPVLSVTMGNNVFHTHSQATAAGYTTANFLRPTIPGGPTVGVGVNLSSDFTVDRLGVPRTGSWDAGAYEFGSSLPSPPRQLRVTSIVP